MKSALRDGVPAAAVRVPGVAPKGKRDTSPSVRLPNRVDYARREKVYCGLDIRVGRKATIAAELEPLNAPH